MKSHASFLLAILAVSSVGFSDEIQNNEFSIAIPFEIATPHVAQGPQIPAPQMHAQPIAAHPVTQTSVETQKAHPFKPFTGKITGKKVRLRLQPDLESYIVKEFSKDDLLVVVGEKEQFWAVECPKDMKAFVFRSFVLDNTIEANRVNIRVEPELDAPVIGFFNAGDHVDGVIAASNPKWLEITPPTNTRFYISKEYVEKIGGPEYKAQFDRRKETAEQLLEASSVLAKVELKKPFPEVDIERISHSLKTLAEDYQDMPALKDKAKEALAKLHEDYLDKKIAYLEAKVDNNNSNETSVAAENRAPDEVTDRMKFWLPVEEAIYLSSRECMANKDMNEYYDDQKLNSISLAGILEPFQSNVKHKPGDYVLKENDQTVGYLYSTCVDLHNYIGKRVLIQATARPNNHFAYPAYYVHMAEKE